MQDTSILDLAIYHQPASRSVDRKRMARYAGGTVVFSAGLLAAAMLPAGQFDVQAVIAAIGMTDAGNAAVGEAKAASDQLRLVSEMSVDDKAQLITAGLAAQERNAAIPLSGLPLEHARGFVMGADQAGSYGTALKCLTQAVYYEAAVEPLQGRRGVAQVILNRMRHPAYPKSVCGVVYQGSERRTGCQFSFTCDGSLLRQPAIGPWREAAAVARAALAGYVETSVGTATHYHADYVLPKWAFQLGKIEQVGRHIFYRFNGSWGNSSALNGAYSGVERIPALNLAALQERLLEDSAVPVADEFVKGLTVAPHVTDRHAESDVGGRIDTTKQWRLSIPDPVQASSRYRDAVGETADGVSPLASAGQLLAIKEQPGAAEPQ